MRSGLGGVKSILQASVKNANASVGNGSKGGVEFILWQGYTIYTLCWRNGNEEMERDNKTGLACSKESHVSLIRVDNFPTVCYPLYQHMRQGVSVQVILDSCSLITSGKYSDRFNLIFSLDAEALAGLPPPYPA